MKRDITIDYLRGFAMSWVILIHCFFWVSFFVTPLVSILKSLLLIEMPLFFWISGASFTIARKKSYFEFLKNRGKRIFVPYWSYVIVCIFLSILLSSDFSLAQWEFFIPVQIPQFGVLFLNSALWFIWPFLLVTITMPFFHYYFDYKKSFLWRIAPLILMLFMVVVTDFYAPNHMQFKCWILYSFFTYLGFFYCSLKEKTNPKMIIAAWIAVISILLTILLGYFEIYSYDMQMNKFKYNFAFLIYNVGILSILYIFIEEFLKLLKYLDKNKIFHYFFEPYQTNCYTIYLFHPIAFLLVDRLLFHFQLYGFIIKYQYWVFPIYFLVIWILSSLIGRKFSFVEEDFWKIETG